MDHINRYLQSYAEPEAKSLPAIGKTYQYSLVIPARNERVVEITQVWSDLDKDQAIVAILVLNSPPGDNTESNETAKRELKRRATQTHYIGNHLLLEYPAGPDILVVDRYSEGKTIPEKKGVGLARKIGSDIALRLYARGEVHSDWLHFTDADVRLPVGYFSSHDASDGCIVHLYPFKHEAPTDLSLACQLYECQMLYYAAGLKWAGSTFGFPTIGSTISCRADGYAKVRGFPQRATGEDFYLLNKLRKLGSVRILETEPIIIAGRISDRVAIGTGPAINAISQLSKPLEDYQVPHPDCFNTLRKFLTLLNNLADTQPSAINHPDSEILEYSASINLADKYFTKLEQNPSSTILGKHLADWFDGLRTRQLIHYMRDNHFGSVPLTKLGNCPFAPGPTHSSVQLATLRRSLANQLTG